MLLNIVTKLLTCSITAVVAACQRYLAGYAPKWSKSSTHRFPHSQDVQFLEIQENVIYGYYYIIIFQASTQLLPKQLHIELEMEDFS